MPTFYISKESSNIIKGLACMLIILHHYSQSLIGLDVSNIIIETIALRGGVTGVAIFFFLSAYGLSESQLKRQTNFIEFAKRRLSKVFIPLIITNLIYYFILLGNNLLNFSLETFPLYITNIKILDGVTWFCNVIFFFYLFFYISYLFKQNIHKIICMFCLTIIYSIFMTYAFKDAPYYVYSIIGFPTGMIFSLYKEYLNNKGIINYLLITTLFFIFASFIFKIYYNLFIANLFSLYIIIIISYTIYKFQSKYHNCKLLNSLGNNSYEIYLLHNKFLFFCWKLNLVWWYPIIFILIIIPFSILLKHIINKTAFKLLQN